MKNSIKAFSCLKNGYAILVAFFILGTHELNAQDTLFQNVTVTTVDSTGAGEDPFWEVRFTVDTTGTNGNANGGWIIQKITLTDSSFLCPVEDGAEPYMATTVRYYEVWPVAPGQDTTAPEFPSGANDRFAVNSGGKPDGTYGTITLVGEVAFVSNPGGGAPATPGHAGGPDTNRTDAGGSTWAPGGVPFAGGLISTLKKPSFWDKLKDSGKVTVRTWSDSWNKCKDKDADDKEEDKEEEVKEDADDKKEDGEGEGRRNQSGNGSQGYLNQEKISFYPNPADREITVYGSDFIQTTIYDVNGSKVVETSERQIDIGHLNTGTYIILFSTRNETVRERLIIE